MTWIPRNTEPSSIILEPSTPSCIAPYASNPNMMFPTDANARIPITKIGVQEYELFMWKIVLSIQSIDGIKNRAYASNNLMPPLPSDSLHGHLRDSNTVTSSLNNATHQYIKNPIAARNMNGTMYVIQVSGTPPHNESQSSKRERANA